MLEIFRPTLQKTCMVNDIYLYKPDQKIDHNSSELPNKPKMI